MTDKIQESYTYYTYTSGSSKKRKFFLNPMAPNSLVLKYSMPNAAEAFTFAFTIAFTKSVNGVLVLL